MQRIFHSHGFQTISGASLGVLLALVLAVAPPCSAQVTEEFHRTVPLSAQGRVSLANINGGVEITGWDQNVVQIDAEKKAPDQQRLDEMRIEVDGSGDSVHIKTQYPEHRSNNNPGSVHYVLHVPRNAQLAKVDLVNGSLNVQQVSGDVEAELVNGKLKASDLSGRARLSTVNGALQANFTSLQDVHDIKLSSVNGSLDLLLPTSPNAEIEASTVSGNIRTDFPLQVKGHIVGKNLDGTLGSGGTRIRLSNVNGSIHIGPGNGTL